MPKKMPAREGSQNSAASRFEVIDADGRAYTVYAADLQVSFQDDGRTLKVFVHERSEELAGASVEGVLMTVAAPLVWKRLPAKGVDAGWGDTNGLYEISDENVLFVRNLTSGIPHDDFKSAVATAQADFDHLIAAGSRVSQLAQAMAFEHGNHRGSDFEKGAYDMAMRIAEMSHGKIAGIVNAEVAEEAEVEISWRNLALQFDQHRMDAKMHIQAFLDGDEAAVEQARAFLAAAPLSGEEVLEKRVAALADARMKQEKA